MNINEIKEEYIMREIKENELVVGNWYDTISFGSCNNVYVDNNPKPFSLEQAEVIRGWGCGVFRAINITNAILGECGFKRSESGHMCIMLDYEGFYTHLQLIKKDNQWQPVIKQSAKTANHECNTVYLNPLTDIDELQNLYRVLSGKELHLTNEVFKSKE